MKVGEFIDSIDRSDDFNNFVAQVRDNYKSSIAELQGDHSSLRLESAQRHKKLLGLDILALDLPKPGPGMQRSDTSELCMAVVSTRQKFEKWTGTSATSFDKTNYYLDSALARQASNLGQTNLPVNGRGKLSEKFQLLSRGPNAPGPSNILPLRQLGLEKLSLFTCYACLLASPSYTLNCGHMVCSDCIHDFSNRVELELQRGTDVHADVHVIPCPFPNCSGLALRKQVPPQAAPRVLSLDG